MAIDTSCNVSLRMDLYTLNTFFIAVIKYLIDTMGGGFYFCSDIESSTTRKAWLLEKLVCGEAPYMTVA